MTSEPIFTISKALRKSTPALIGLWGPSGTGKTFSALHIARGLVGPAGKIGLIDTENRRAEFYADEAGGWDHIDLQPPFTPDRYCAAFSAFEQAGGYGCIIVDSMSHVWAGEGGVLDMAENSRTRDGRELTGLAKWKAPKTEYVRLVNSLLRAPFHVIFCLRAKDGVKQVGSGKSASIESIGLQPICGKGFIHEMTVSALLGHDHLPAFQTDGQSLRCDPLTPALKAPGPLWRIFETGKPLGAQTGQDIARWVSGAAAWDADQATLERTARDVATMGSVRYRQYFKSLTNEQRSALLKIHEELKAIAMAADAETSGPDDLPAADVQL